MHKYTLALTGLVVLISIAIGIRVMLPDANNPEGSEVKAVQEPVAGRADIASTGSNTFTIGRGQPAGAVSSQKPDRAKPEQETADINNSAIPAPTSSEGSSFSGNEAYRPTDAEVKRYIELKKETLAMQKGPDALAHYYELKQKREQKTLAREEYRKQRKEYEEQRREWKLMLDEAEERARITGDNFQVDELRKLEPIRPKRKLKQPVEATKE